MSKALDGAERKGAEAFKAGQPESANPYDDVRDRRGSVTWSRAFMRAWHDGYHKAKAKAQRAMG
jgi:hypothetical protein